MSMKNVNFQHQYNKKDTHSYAVGVYATIELLSHKPAVTREVFLHTQGSSNKGVIKIRELCQKNKIRVNYNDGFINKISEKDNVYAVAVFDKYTSEVDPQSNHIVLVNPSDMGNAGTIMRTMLAFNYLNLVILRPGIDVFNPKAVRASMGALFHLNVTYFDSIDQYRSKYSQQIYPFMTGGNQLLNDVHFQQPHALVFGNEASGLPESYRKVGTAVTIPQSEDVDSLNVGVAVGIGIYAAASSK